MDQKTVKVISNFYLDINQFKTKKCYNVDKKHNKKYCFFYHNNVDKRRNPLVIDYCHIMCINLKKCQKLKCNYSHNLYESYYHKMNYKKKLCFNYFNNNNCQFGNYCSFAHAYDELNVNFIHELKFDRNFFIYIYKTEFCFLGKIKHNKTWCVYAHNFQDYRRPFKINLLKKICKNWNLEHKYLNYDDLCKDGMDCNFCHGYKEFDFLPQNYKKKICISYLNSKEKCNFGGICHFLHQNITFEKYNKNLKYNPKNIYSLK